MKKIHQSISYISVFFWLCTCFFTKWRLRLLCGTHWHSNRISCCIPMSGVWTKPATCWYLWRSFSVGTSGDDVTGRDSGGLSLITSIGWVSRLSAAGLLTFSCSVPARAFVFPHMHGKGRIAKIVEPVNANTYDEINEPLYIWNVIEYFIASSGERKTELHNSP